MAAAVVLGRSRYVLSNRIRTSLASLTRRSTSCSARRTSLSICTMSQAMPNRQRGSCRYQLSVATITILAIHALTIIRRGQLVGGGRSMG